MTPRFGVDLKSSLISAGAIWKFHCPKVRQRGSEGQLMNLTLRAKESYELCFSSRAWESGGNHCVRGWSYFSFDGSNEFGDKIVFRMFLQVASICFRLKRSNSDGAIYPDRAEPSRSELFRAEPGRAEPEDQADGCQTRPGKIDCEV